MPTAQAEPAARTACLPMYDPPHLAAANDALWAAIARRLAAAGIRRVPEHLSRGDDLDALWTDRNLLLGQTCGYPLTTRLGGRVRVVATPIHDAPGCDGPTHCSRITVRADSRFAALADLRGTVCAINEPTSNTGMNLLRAALAPIAGGRPMFREIRITGSHAASLRAVAAGEADVAAADCMTWALLADAEPALAQRLRCLAETPASPALPFITAAGTDDATCAALYGALAEALADPDLAPVRRALRLEGVAPPADYARVLDLERQAAALGYPALA